MATDPLFWFEFGGAVLKNKELTPGGFVKKAIELWKSDNKVMSIDAFIDVVENGDVKTLESSLYLQNYIGHCYVFQAARRNHNQQLKVVEWLLFNGLDVNAKPPPPENKRMAKTDPPLFVAALNDCDALFQLLLDSGAEMVDDRGNHVLLEAARGGAVTVLRRLIGMGLVNAYARDKSDGATALHVAKTVEAARLLIEAKLDPMLTTNKKESVLYSQIGHYGDARDSKVFDYIWSILTEQQRTTLLALKTLNQRTILHAAARSGKPSLVQFLLARPEIDASAVDGSGSTILMESVIDVSSLKYDHPDELECVECARLILRTDHGHKSINAVRSDGCTALHLAALNTNSNCYKSFDLLLDFGQHSTITPKVLSVSSHAMIACLALLE